MPIFDFEALDQHGNVARASIKASSLSEVVAQLARDGAKVLSIREQHPTNELPSASGDPQEPVSVSFWLRPSGVAVTVLLVLLGMVALYFSMVAVLHVVAPSPPWRGSDVAGTDVAERERLGASSPRAAPSPRAVETPVAQGIAPVKQAIAPAPIADPFSLSHCSFSEAGIFPHGYLFVVRDGKAAAERELRVASAHKSVKTGQEATIFERRTIEDVQWLRIRAEDHSVGWVEAQYVEEGGHSFRGKETSNLPSAEQSRLWRLARNAVSAELKAPSTADFPWMWNVEFSDLGDGGYGVDAYVDAQNGYGATIRRRFRVQFQRLEGKVTDASAPDVPDERAWRLTGVNFFE